MKKLIIALTATVVAVSVFAQGTVTFNNRVTGVVVAPITGLDSLGLGGTGYTAELWAASGADAAEGSLQAAAPQTAFRTGAAVGFVTAVTATLTGVAKDAAAATLQVRVWDNKGGTLTTWAAAETAWMAGEIAAGKSTLFNVTAIGGDLNTPPNLVGLTSFQLIMVPEPSTFALLGLGALGMLIFRRK
jgi:hypothetical protein